MEPEHGSIPQRVKRLAGTEENHFGVTWEVILLVATQLGLILIREALTMVSGVMMFLQILLDTFAKHLFEF